MKHLSKFKAKQVAEYIRSQYERIEYADIKANQIENQAHSDGMIFHFAVSDAVGSNRMREIESKCVMYVEHGMTLIERA